MDQSIIRRPYLLIFSLYVLQANCCARHYSGVLPKVALVLRWPMVTHARNAGEMNINTRVHYLLPGFVLLNAFCR